MYPINLETTQTYFIGTEIANYYKITGEYLELFKILLHGELIINPKTVFKPIDTSYTEIQVREPIVCDDGSIFGYKEEIIGFNTRYVRNNKTNIFVCLDYALSELNNTLYVRNVICK